MLALGVVAIAAFFGTWRAGLVTAVICHACAKYFFVVPRSLSISEAELVAVASYYLIVGAVLFLSHRASTADKELRAITAQLRDTDLSRSQFFSMLSHELRNPLAAIRTTTDLLNSQALGAAQAARARTVLDRQVTHLTGLVDDLLEVTRVTQGEPSLGPESLPMASLMASAAEAALPFLQQRGQKLNIRVAADTGSLQLAPAPIRQTLGNLLRIASTFSSPGSEIKLEAERLGDQVCLSVSDPAEASNDGPGPGVSFRIVLPCASGKRARPPVMPAAGDPGQPLKVLVVDDNKDAGESMAMLLELKGFRTSAASDGASGIARALAEQPDVVLMDIGLPDMSGHEAGERIRREMHGQGPVLIALTGWGTQEDKARSKAAGFQYHLTKPISADEVSALLKSIEQKRHA
jgi:CheY-like chemotaxis protein